MKAVISILIVAVVGLLGWRFWQYWEQKNRESGVAPTVATGPADGQQLPGIPSQLETSLQKAQQQGPKALKQWLDTYRRSPLVTDPRLAWVELDYVLLVSKEDPAEARRVFASVKQRTPPHSPVYPRIQSLEKTYE
jgi:hypothetical protein